jgi:hypothetical protein
MRRAALAAGLVLMVAAGGQAFATPADSACALSGQEAALVRATADRVAFRASTKAFGDAESRVLSTGCGVWSIVVGPDGAVVSTQRLRGSHRGSFVDVVEPWLRKNKYQTSERQWTGLVLVTMTPKDSE